MSKESVGRRISRIRNSLGLTQEELEKKSGVARRTIQDVEGDRSDPRLSSLVALSETLQVSLDTIAYGEKPKPKVTASDMTPEEFARAIAIASQTSDPDKAELLSLIEKVPSSRIRALIRRIDVFLKASPNEPEMSVPRRRVNRRRE